MMKISIVIPCYNEEEMLDYTVAEFQSFFTKNIQRNLFSDDSEIIFVDDGSQDKTWDKIYSATTLEPYFKGVKLSRNKGHQNALLAGISCAKGDFIITIDADLQDDINAISEMVKLAKNGSEVVYGVRKSRETDTKFKKVTAEAYYKVMKLFGVELVFNHADFRGMSKRAVQSLLEYKEVNLFLRGIIPQLGYTTSIVYYDRKERIAGETKYPLKKMLSFAWQGITSFSTIPLKVLTWMGSILALISIGITIWAIGVKLFSDSAVPGWASTVIPIVFLGGVQLLGLGILGEYLGKVYLEVKGRPRFFIENITDQVDMRDERK